MQDALRSPIVRSINTEQYHGLPEDEIFIHAVDDFMVKSVLVTIMDDDGNVIEQGEAVQSVLSFSWVYEARIENPYPRGCTIRVTAKDLPGNEGSLQSVI